LPGARRWGARALDAVDERLSEDPRREDLYLSTLALYVVSGHIPARDQNQASIPKPCDLVCI